MQAIITKYIPATNTKSSRVKAECERGSIVVSYDSAESEEAAHRWAVNKLVERFAAEDAKRYQSDPISNPWLRKTVCGSLPQGNKYSYAFVFVQ